MQIIDYNIVLERCDIIEGIGIDKIINQKYNKETSEIEIKFLDMNGLQHTITSMYYIPDNEPALTFECRCVSCGDTKKATISDLNDIKTICKYRNKPVTTFEKIESLINEFQSTKDFFTIINAVSDKNPFSCCDICSYKRPQMRP